MRRILQSLLGLVASASLATLTALSTSAAHAQPAAYPTKQPIKLLVGFAAGGPTDVIARVLAQEMGATLGQSIVIENRTGANALIATEAVARATPDGYTLLFTSLSFNVNTLLMKKISYDPARDFAPITLAATLPMVLVASPALPAASVADLLKLAKAQPGAISYGSAGKGGSAHLAAALFEQQGGAQMTHVPFRGNAPALTDVMAGNVSFMFYPIIGVADQVAQKRLKVLGVGTPAPHPDFPGVPTFTQAGYPSLDDTAPWVGLLAPAGTPGAIVKRLNDAARQALTKPDVRERLRGLGAVIVGDSPSEFAAYLVKDRERWARVVKAAQIEAE